MNTNAALDAGYNDTPLEDAEAPTETAPETPELQAPEFKSITADEYARLIKAAEEVDALKAELPSEIRKVYGKLGAFNQTLTASPEITDEDMEALNDYDDIKNGVKTALGRILSKVPRVANVDLPQLKTIEDRLYQAEQRATIAEQRAAQAEITALHPDWKSVVKDDAYQSWVSSLPQEEAQELRSTWDASKLADGISRFKSAKRPSKSSNPLANTVTPKASGGVTTESNDLRAALQAGYDEG